MFHLLCTVCNYGQEWEVATIETYTQYRAGLHRHIKARIGVKIGLHSINVTLLGAVCLCTLTLTGRHCNCIYSQVSVSLAPFYVHLLGAMVSDLTIGDVLITKKVTKIWNILFMAPIFGYLQEMHLFWSIMFETYDVSIHQVTVLVTYWCSFPTKKLRRQLL